ncbi:exported hypothetical protein [Candidatus Sulfotelmatomonas gaucii]|uniref:Lipoprotein n=1 Tax=Candidatus Sulfuritelmatomonas gaucii TaxID=2043161 RepID=A0A2N9L3P4_9BACT|nr:exported hypothetical protein [Candidatus Sulfotelmatomonas gaucii]
MTHRIWRHMIWVGGAMLLAALSTGCKAAQPPATSGAAAQAAQNTGGAQAGVKTIAVPNGGTIYLGALAGQPTPPDAMGKVMQRVTALCGDRPQLGKLDKNTTGEILAGFFTVTGKNLDGKPMEGLAIVYAPKTGTAGGAVLLDDADRFPTTVNSMFTRLKQVIAPSASSSGAAPASGSGAASNAGPSAAAAAPVKSGPAQPLQRAVFPDGTGSIGLPAGWQMQNAQKGDVSAAGPHGEKLRFGWTIAVIDPTNPQSRALMGNSRGAAPGNFVAIPHSADPATAFKAAFTQLAQKARKQPPAIDIAKVQDIAMQGGANEFMFGDIDFNDGQGKQYLVAQMISTPVVTMGTWQMTLHVMYGPQQVMGQEASTIAEIFPNYSRNTQMVNAIVNQQIQQSIAQTNQFVNTVAQYNDSSDRMTAGMSNMLRDQTVVVDTQTGGHATTSDDLAGALIGANPNRFQSVSPSGYIPGIDY